jgi:hypothetical protein
MFLTLLCPGESRFASNTCSVPLVVTGRLVTTLLARIAPILLFSRPSANQASILLQAKAVTLRQDLEQRHLAAALSPSLLSLKLLLPAQESQSVLNES